MEVRSRLLVQVFTPVPTSTWLGSCTLSSSYNILYHSAEPPGSFMAQWLCTRRAPHPSDLSPICTVLYSDALTLGPGREGPSHPGLANSPACRHTFPIQTDQSGVPGTTCLTFTISFNLPETLGGHCCYYRHRVHGTAKRGEVSKNPNRKKEEHFMANPTVCSETQGDSGASKGEGNGLNSKVNRFSCAQKP